MADEKLRELSGGFGDLVDLTYSLSPRTAAWPGDRDPEFTWVSSIPDDAANVSRLDVNVHTGTHVDAPRHFLDDGAGIDELPLETFCGSAVVYSTDAEPKGQRIELSDVKASGLDLKEGDIFILNSGLASLKGEEEYFKKFPVPSTELLEWLLDRGIKCYGTDCPSVDPLGTETHENHKLLFSAGIPVIENLAHLDRLEGVSDFTVIVFPLKLKSLEASPCRAVAMVK